MDRLLFFYYDYGPAHSKNWSGYMVSFCIHLNAHAVKGFGTLRTQPLKGFELLWHLNLRQELVLV